MTTKTGFYGSDDTSNKFKGQDGIDYFTLVNKKTGEVEIYQEAFGADKRVGNIGVDGKITYNQNWWGGARNKDKEWVNANLKTIKSQSLNTIKNGLREEEGLTGDALDNKAKKLNQAANKAAGLDLEEASKPANFDLGKESEPTPGTRDKDFGVHVFPSTLRQGRDGQDFLKIDMLKFVARELQGTVGNIDGGGHLGIKERAKPFSKDRQSIGTVILPVPGGLRDNMQVKWQNDTINPFQLAIANIALNTVEQGLAAGLEAAEAAVMTAINTPDTKDALGKYFAGQAANANNLLTRTTGAIMNPNMELLFNGPDTRNFTFSFILAPRNQQEGKDIIRIIRFFKL